MEIQYYPVCIHLSCFHSKKLSFQGVLYDLIQAVKNHIQEKCISYQIVYIFFEAKAESLKKQRYRLITLSQNYLLSSLINYAQIQVLRESPLHLIHTLLSYLTYNQKYMLAHFSLSNIPKYFLSNCWCAHQNNKKQQLAIFHLLFFPNQNKNLFLSGRYLLNIHCQLLSFVQIIYQPWVSLYQTDNSFFDDLCFSAQPNLHPQIQIYILQAAAIPLQQQSLRFLLQ